MKTPDEKCELFLDAIPLDLAYEFEGKYCHGEKYYSYAKTHPADFVKAAIGFSFSHKDNPYFQGKANQHLGTESDRAEMLGQNGTIKEEKSGIKSSEAVKEPDKAYMQPQEPHPQPSQQRVTQSQIYSPHRPRTEEELQKSIARKLFGIYQTHDRYTRLTAEEIQYIVQNVGLSKRERDVFLLKCGKRYLTYMEIGDKLDITESTVKKRAIHIDKMIKAFLFGDSIS